MRVLLAIHNVYTEFTSGAARSVRTMMDWLAGDRHACQVLSTGRFEATPDAELRSHLTELGIQPRRHRAPSGCVLNDFTVAGVAVTAMETQGNSPTEVDQEESRQFLAVFQEKLRRFRPDLVLTYSGHPVTVDALRIARARGIATLRTVRAYGYEDRAWFAHADRVLTGSSYVSRHFQEHIGLRSTALPSPIVWSEVLGSDDTRGFLTFINPSLHKGAALFARLADMLGQERPDIPILIVQTAIGADRLANTPGLDLARYPQIVVSPPIPDARDLYSLTRILLVPSVFHEPFGRVAAEAMINGIPALVSDRGALPETVGAGGLVLPIPDWMEPSGHRVPHAEQIRPWYEAVTRLWDDPEAYRQAADIAKAEAVRLYDESALRRRYLAYLADPGPHPPLFETDTDVAPVAVRQPRR